MTITDDDDRAAMPDDENPEWTAEDFKNARPGLVVIAEVFGAEMAEALRRGPDRPPNQVLREHMPTHQE